MSATIGLTCLGIAGVVLAFTLLQLATEERWRGFGAALLVTVAGLIMAATSTPNPRAPEIWDTARRSDAIGLGITVAIVAVLAGVLLSGGARRLWCQIAVTVLGLTGVAGGLAAVAIGRSTASWEFAAVACAGLALALSGGMGAWDRSASINRRLALGTQACCGAFSAVGGVLLAAAWTALA